MAEAEWTRRLLFLAPHCGGKKRLRSNTCEHERHDNANSELSFTVVRSAVEKAGGDFMARHVHHFLMAGFVVRRLRNTIILG